MIKKAVSGLEFQVPNATGESVRFGGQLQPPNVRHLQIGIISVFETSLSETPSTKPQAPEKLQISNTKPQYQLTGQTARRSVFELGASCLGSQLLKN